MRSALSAMSFISGIGYTDAIDWFKECVGINIQVVENGPEVDIFLFGFLIVAIFGQDNQVAVIPPYHIYISFQAVGCPETDMVVPEVEGREASTAAEDCLMVC